MNARRCLRLAAMGLCAALTAAEASAQTISEADRAARVDLLARAQAAHRAGQLDDALRLVGQAERIGVTAGTSLLTARIHATAGHPAAALASVERCVREVDLDGQTTAANRQALRTACEGLRAEVAPRVAHLTVRVPSDAPVGLVVRVNEEIVRPANYGAPRTVDPGTQRVVATVPGRPPWERMESVSAGASATVEVVVPAAPAAAAPPRVEGPLTPPPPPPVVVPVGPAVDAPAPSGSAQRTLGVVSGALGVGLLATGVVGGLMFGDTESEYTTDRCASQASPSMTCRDQYSTLETLNTVQWIGYVGGGLLVATGAILLLTAPSRASAAPRVSVGLTPGGATLGYAGSF